MVVYDEDFDYDEASQAAIASNKQVMVIDRVLQAWRKRPSVNNAGGEASRRLHLHFYAKPLEVVTDDDGRVAAFRWERTRPDGEGGVVGTGEIREVPIQAIYRAVGYFGSPLPGVPFDKRHGVIPNHEGQALRKDSNERVPGVYATGWIKRGPVGLIGHTKSDAMETVRHIINDQGSWWQPADPVRGGDPGAARGARRALDRPRGLASPRRARGRPRRSARPRAHQGRAARRDGRRLARRVAPASAA